MPDGMIKTPKVLIIRGRLVGNTALFNERDASALIDVSFYPSEYSTDKSNTYAEASVPGLGSPLIQFGSGRTKTLSLELLLDTYTYDGGRDIREAYMRKFDRLVEVDGEFHAPPPCKVIWGSLEFVGLVESMRKRYVLFRDDGIPVRARVTLTFKEYVPLYIQVKRSPLSSPDRLKKYVVKEGDSLWLLAYREYGHSRSWRLIAEANGIDDPLSLEPGMELVLPPLAVK